MSSRNEASEQPKSVREPHRMLYRAAFLSVALVMWALAGTVFFSDIIPPVGETLTMVGDLLTGSFFYEQLWLTGQRVLMGFAVAYTFGMIIGIAMGRSKRVEAFFEMFIIIGTSQPGLFVAMIILVALGLKSSTAVITLGYLATPIVTISLWQGAKNLDPGLNEVAKVFGYGPVAKVRHIVLPQLFGPALAGLRQGLGLTWKYVVMIELIGLNDGVGYQVTRNFELFDLTGVVAWTICFLLVVLFIEYAVIRTAERHLFAWQSNPTGRVKTNISNDPELVTPRV